MSPLSILYILPKNWVSRFVGLVVSTRLPFDLHTSLKLWFIRKYKVNIEEAEYPIEKYPTLGAFFTRQLKKGQRPLANSHLVSPADGKVTRQGDLEGTNPELPQVKDIRYSLAKILEPHYEAKAFLGGMYRVIYLAPFNYHRVHSPVKGELKSISHVPGELWPVNNWSVQRIEGLFYRNERMTFEISSDVGKVLVIMVGATNVGKITTPFHPNFVGNSSPNKSSTLWAPQESLPIEKGQEIGCFGMGSTVIIIADANYAKALRTEKGQVSSGASAEFTEDVIQMGEALN